MRERGQGLLSSLHSLCEPVNNFQTLGGTYSSVFKNNFLFVFKVPV